MVGLMTWYDILGILPGASTDEVRCACEAASASVSDVCWWCSAPAWPVP
jgi:hypothetical protein